MDAQPQRSSTRILHLEDLLVKILWILLRSPCALRRPELSTRDSDVASLSHSHWWDQQSVKKGYLRPSISKLNP